MKALYTFTIIIPFKAAVIQVVYIEYTMECALTETNKRKPLLLLDGYEHRFDRMSKDGTKTFFRCIRRGCKGRAHAPTDGREAIMVVQHGHNPDRQRAQVFVSNLPVDFYREEQEGSIVRA